MTTTIHAAVLAPVGRDERTPGDIWQFSSSNLYDEIMSIPSALRRDHAVPIACEVIEQSCRDSNAINYQPDPEGVKGLLKTVRSNIVQSIRAFRVPELTSAADLLGHHFLYAHCGHAYTKSEVLESITSAFFLPRPYGKNFDTLSSCLTDVLHKVGPQPGFVIVLEGLPCTQKFDKEARETLLDIFRDAADFWADKKIPFRVFYAFV